MAKKKFKAEAREGVRPGDPCEHCGEPKKLGFTILNFGLNMDVGMCMNDACPGKHPDLMRRTERR